MNTMREFKTNRSHALEDIFRRDFLDALDVSEPVGSSFNPYLRRNLETLNRDKRERFWTRSSVVRRRAPHRERSGKPARNARSRGESRCEQISSRPSSW